VERDVPQRNRKKGKMMSLLARNAKGKGVRLRRGTQVRREEKEKKETGRASSLSKKGAPFWAFVASIVGHERGGLREGGGEGKK